MGKRLLKIRTTKPYQYLKYRILYFRPFFRYLLKSFPKEIGEKPIFIFNHVPKCGGSSFLNILQKKFRLIRDYPPHDLEYPNPDELKEKTKFHENNKPDLYNLKPWEILCGHYHRHGFYVKERFPEIFNKERIHLISLIRDPLDHRFSLYFYGKKKNHKYVEGFDLNSYLLTEVNYIAKSLGCTKDNYQQVIDSYFFIGLVEEYNLSMSILSKLLNLEMRENIPHINTAKRNNEVENLPQEMIEEFRKLNELDYLVYEYARKQFNKKLSQNNL